MGLDTALPDRQVTDCRHICSYGLQVTDRGHVCRYGLQVTDRGHVCSYGLQVTDRGYVAPSIDADQAAIAVAGRATALPGAG